MCCGDRVALVGLIWFVLWTAAGDGIGHWFGVPGTGLVLGFLFAVASVFAWPWIIPRPIEDWMHDPRG